MRQAIYYWKCDCPRPEADRAAGFTAAKYEGGGIEIQVRAACRGVLGGEPDAVEPLRCAGDHFAYAVTQGGRRLLFRASADATGDDYMLAEAALMARAAAQGVPVPAVLHTEAAEGGALRWQLMTFVEGSTIADLHRAGSLVQPAIAAALGRLLRRLHAVRLDGFGFVDTRHLRATGTVRCLHARYGDYVACRLEDHLAYVRDHGLLGPDQARRAARLLERHGACFDRPQAALVHRDPAWWNLIGGRDGIAALIDWDDAVGGDPADDLAMLHCFHDAGYCRAVEAAYWDAGRPDAGWQARIALHFLRNMLWKAKLRHQLGYFRPGAAAFIGALDPVRSLESTTRAKLSEALLAVEAIA